MHILTMATYYFIGCSSSVWLYQSASPVPNLDLELWLVRESQLLLAKAFTADTSFWTCKLTSDCEQLIVEAQEHFSFNWAHSKVSFQKII